VLSPYRVIDLSNERGLLCGQILADLGADVIQVEPPEGNSAREIGPWYKGERSPEHSLFWWAYTRNKRSIVLDLEDPESREELLGLIRGADFLIESDRPGRMAELGFGYEELALENPQLIYISITPFGQTGPKASWHDSDLTQMASAGHLYLSGDAGLAPLRVRVPQGHAHAASDAAVAALIAHRERKRTGLGQQVDISIQQSVTLATMFRSLDAPLEQTPAERISGGVHIAGYFMHTRYRLVDGWVVLGPAFLPSTGHFMTRLIQYALDSGFGDPSLLEEDWGQLGAHILFGIVEGESFEPTSQMFEQFFATLTKEELMRNVLERKLLLAPVMNVSEICESPQLRDRGFDIEHTHSEPKLSVRYPGPSIRFTKSPIRYRLPPPRLDEHADEIRLEPRRSKPAARGEVEIEAPEVANGESPLPLEGVKILDLFWVLAGPGATRMLADYGATVVRVESTRHVDTLRVIPPYQFSNPNAEGAGGFQSANANKLGMTLDITEPRGREIFLDLVRWADVVTESFAPGVMAQYGLSYEDLSAVKPEIIMISSCLMGQTGPWRDFTGFGNLAAAVTGFQDLSSRPGRAPSGPHGAYTDFIGVRYNAIAILAALEHRDRTGEGQYIDQSQAESGLHFLAPAYLDYTVNGSAGAASANKDLVCSPHGCFPCAGDDRWVAIAVRTDAEWQQLCKLIEAGDLVANRADAERVDDAIADWTRIREVDEVVAALQAQGIPSHGISDMPTLYEDAQLRHRDHFIEMEHEIYQTTHVESSRLKFSRSRAKRPERALSFGRDNQVVLGEILGYSEERIAELTEAKILE
jgi:crotonobetainyl-CoA:carnitine CoA-transferase CaiB-like acyl-CoA transferase